MSDNEQLLVELVAKVDQFERNIAKASKAAEQNFGAVEKRAKAMADGLKSQMEKAASGVQGAFSKVGNSFLGAAGVGGLGLSALMASVVKFNGEIAKIPGLAREAGVSIERIQEIKFAANVKGVGDDEFTAGMRTSLALIDEASRNVNTLRRLFNANGESIRDQNGDLIKFDDLLAIAARLMAGARTEQERIKIAEMVGLSRDWVKVLRDGPEAFRASAAEAHNVGAVIDKETVQRAKEFDKQWNIAVVKFKAGMIEGLADLSQAFTDFWRDVIPGSGFIQDKLESWFGGLRGMTIPELKEALEKSIEQGLDQFEIDRLQAEIDRRMGKTPLRIRVTPDTGGGAQSAPGSTNVPRDVQNTPFDEAVREATKRIATTEAETRAINEGTAARERAKMAATLEEAAKRANTEAGFANATVTAEQRTRIDELSEAYARAAQKASETRAASDLYFQSLQLGRSETEQAVASQLRSIYGEKYLEQMNGAIAGQIRFNEALKDTRAFSENALSGFVKDLRDGKSAADALGSVLNKLSDKLIDMAAQQLISGAFSMFTGGMGGGLGGLFGGNPTGFATNPWSSSGMFGGLFHSGRGPGDPTTAWRGVPASVFASAPRFHTGIGPGELPAVIRRDESVLTPGQMRQLAPVGQGGGGPITVNVMNAPAGTNAEVKTQQQPGGGVRIDVELKRMADSAVASSIRSREGDTYQAIKDTFGAKDVM